jgi:hypothetical protein
MTPEEASACFRMREQMDVLLRNVAELEAERDLFIRAIGRVTSGLPLDPPPAWSSALVVDALEALGRLATQHQEMTAALDAFNAALGRAANRASEGRLVQTFAGAEVRAPDMWDEHARRVLDESANSDELRVEDWPNGVYPADGTRAACARCHTPLVCQGKTWLAMGGFNIGRPHKCHP